jgi:GxxExxY protein
MSTDNKEFLYKDLSYKVIGLAMEVHSKLGYGFLEKVYENALILLLRREGVHARQQEPIKVHFEGEIIGEYLSDILVEDKIALELKYCVNITDAHRAQTLNYLKARGLRVAIILNFSKTRLEYERLIN